MITPSSRLEISCVLHWFHLWNAGQKEEFLRSLLGQVVPPSLSSDPSGVLVDSLRSLSLSHRSPSVLSCQLGLFETYFQTWDSPSKRVFLQLLGASDRIFVERFYERLRCYGVDVDTLN